MLCPHEVPDDEFCVACIEAPFRERITELESSLAERNQRIDVLECKQRQLAGRILDARLETAERDKRIAELEAEVERESCSASHAEENLALEKLAYAERVGQLEEALRKAQVYAQPERGCTSAETVELLRSKLRCITGVIRQALDDKGEGSSETEHPPPEKP